MWKTIQNFLNNKKKSLSQSRISDLLKPSREKKSAIGDFLECTYDRLRIKTMFGS
jgi:hypothetical protein